MWQIPLKHTVKNEQTGTLILNSPSHISSYAHIYGQNDYSAKPFVPIGMESLVHDKPQRRWTFAEHCKKGFVLVKNGVGYSDRPRVDHPHFPAPVVLECHSKHETFLTVLRKCPSTLGLVVDERLHDDGDKLFGTVVVLPVDVGVG